MNRSAAKFGKRSPMFIRDCTRSQSIFNYTRTTARMLAQLQPVSERLLSDDVCVSAWCLRSEGVSSVLLGVSNTEQLMENLGSIGVRTQPFQRSAASWP